MRGVGTETEEIFVAGKDFHCFAGMRISFYRPIAPEKIQG